MEQQIDYIRGDAYAALQLRSLTGYGALYDATCDAKTFDTAHTARQKVLGDYITTLYNGPTFRYLSFLSALDMLNKRYFVIQAEPGYIVNKEHLSHTYIAFMAPRIEEQKFLDFADENINMHVCLSDIGSAQQLYADMDAPPHLMRVVTKDRDNRYFMFASARYPFEEFRHMDETERTAIASKWMFVQITACLAGERTELFTAVMTILAEH